MAKTHDRHALDAFSTLLQLVALKCTPGHGVHAPRVFLMAARQPNGYTGSNQRAGQYVAGPVVSKRYSGKRGRCCHAHPDPGQGMIKVHDPRRHQGKRCRRVPAGKGCLA